MNLKLKINYKGLRNCKLKLNWLIDHFDKIVMWMQLDILLGIKVISLNIWTFQDLKNINISLKSIDFTEMLIYWFWTYLMAFHWLRPGVKPTEKVWISNYNFPSIWAYQMKPFILVTIIIPGMREWYVHCIKTKTYFFSLFLF